MRSLMLRRVLTWVLATLMLVTLAIALVIVWTANQREWYLDLPGVSATLDMSLTSGGRLIATAVLAGLMALCLATLVVEFASVRHFGGVPHEEPGTSTAGKSFTYSPAGPMPPRQMAPPPSAEPGSYASAIVGEAGARRAEQSLPPRAAGRDDETETLPPAARIAKQRPTMRPHAVQLGVESGPHHPGLTHSTVPLHNGNRR